MQRQLKNCNTANNSSDLATLANDKGTLSAAFQLRYFHISTQN